MTVACSCRRRAGKQLFFCLCLQTIFCFFNSQASFQIHWIRCHRSHDYPLIYHGSFKFPRLYLVRAYLFRQTIVFFLKSPRAFFPRVSSVAHILALSSFELDHCILHLLLVFISLISVPFLIVLVTTYMAVPLCSLFPSMLLSLVLHSPRQSRFLVPSVSMVTFQEMKS